ncbi:MAG: GNAT family N-acetyltransferase [Beijerinckiaceae bacterium]
MRVPITSAQVDTDRFDDVKAAVGSGLSAYNDQFLPRPREATPFAASVRNDEGSVIGGAVGYFRLDWLYIDLLWVEDPQRGKGYGATLMALAEQEARARGATHITLWTWSFQAPSFYVAQGSVECGRIANHPKGHDFVQFVKWLG